ncbi:hypothetical protein [Streptomyces sp. A1136]|uniref:hypothetical protein n=1 Tax=Streptomyces sp. A1136 TaxID=2563102 RepID=UPI00109EB8CE|nr:hypothetical protein [Streptomyces sp. A1136]THA46066.1 hypothetical protein E6R62_34930 [Streptomyces sp. A1136]
MQSENAGGYLIFKIDEQKNQIVVARTGVPPAHDDFVEAFPEREPRYAVNVVQYSAHRDDDIRAVTVFSLWLPTDSPVKAQMVYTSSAAAAPFAERSL